MYRLRVFAMPRATTHLAVKAPLRAFDIVTELQKTALCMASVELPFTFRAAPVTETHHLETATAGEAATGEMVAGEAGEVEVE